MLTLMADHDVRGRGWSASPSRRQEIRVAQLIVEVVRAGVHAEAVWLEVPVSLTAPDPSPLIAGTRPGGPPTPLEALATGRGREPRVITVNVPDNGSSYSDPIGRLTVLLDSGTTDRRPALSAFARLAGAAVGLARELDRRGDPDLLPGAPREDTDVPSGAG